MKHPVWLSLSPSIYSSIFSAHTLLDSAEPGGNCIWWCISSFGFQESSSIDTEKPCQALASKVHQHVPLLKQNLLLLEDFGHGEL